MSSRILWFASFSEMAGEVHEGSAWSEAWNPSELAQNSWNRSQSEKYGMCSSAQAFPGLTAL